MDMGLVYIAGALMIGLGALGAAIGVGLLVVVASWKLQLANLN